MRKTYKFWAWLLCFSMIVSAISAPVYIGATEVETESIVEEVVSEEETIELEVTDIDNSVEPLAEDVGESEVEMPMEEMEGIEAETEAFTLERSEFETTEEEQENTECVTEVVEENTEVVVETDAVYADGEESVFEYTLDSNNNAMIRSYSGTGATLNIPENIDGYTVVGIAAYVFKNKKELETVVIPDTVTSIGGYAFQNCSNLANLTLSSRLVKLDVGAFQNCDALTSVEIPKSITNGGGGSYTELTEIGAFAYCDNLQTIAFEEGIEKIPNYLFANCIGLEEIVIPDTVTTIGKYAFARCTGMKEIIIPDSVTGIEEAAFARCSNLVNLSLSSTLISMGGGAFLDCDALTNVKIPKSLEDGGKVWASSVAGAGAFRNCDNLQTVIFEEGTTAIAKYLFANCVGLKEITIPDTVTKIGEYAFSNCTGIEKMQLPEGIISIEKYAFYYCTNLEGINLPEGITSIEDYVFYNCASLKEIHFPDNLTLISDYAFYNCTNLEKITLPESLTKIGKYAFAACKKFEEVIIPNNVTNIGDYVFYNCTSLEKVLLPNEQITIVKGMFKNCSNLTSFELPVTVTTVQQEAFQNSGLTEIVLQDNISSIGEYAFSDCDALTSITLPNSVRSLSRYVFSECDALASVIIPNSVTSLDDYAFSNCDALASVIIPDSVTSLGYRTFSDCDALTSITIPDSVTRLDDYVFSNCDALIDVRVGIGVTEIPSCAFYACTVLPSIVLPYTIKSIGQSSFANCTSLTEVTIPSATTKAYNNSFSNSGQLTIYGVSGTYAETIANAVGATFVNKEVNATEVSLDKEELELKVGKSATLNVAIAPREITDAVIWESSDTEVATVSEAGVVKAVGTGEAIVQVTVGELSASCAVVVTQPVTGISLNTGGVSLDAFSTYQLTATMKPDTASNKNIAWSSSDENIASVDANGLVTALSKGEAIITAAALDGSNVTATCKVTVRSNVYYCTSVDEIESEHNYSNNCSDVWIYTEPGAEALLVTFDERTNVRQDWDHIYIYNADGTMVGTYTGTELAGRTIGVIGETVKIKLSSYIYNTEWGFKVTKIVGTEIATGVIATGSCGENVIWSLYLDGTLKITGEGAMDDFSYYSPWYEAYRDTIKRVEFGEGVTSVGRWSFYSHYSLESVVFSSTIKEIKSSAFYGASELKRINNFEEGLLRVPETVECLDGSCFGYTGFTDVYLDENLKKVDGSAFAALELNSFTIAENVESFENSSSTFICDTLYIGKDVTGAWWRTKYSGSGGIGFIEESDIKNVVIDAENKELMIIDDIFYAKNDTGYTLAWVLTDAEYIVFPTDIVITEIGESAFEWHPISGVLVIPDTVKAIGHIAFADCDNLTEVVLPSGLTSLGQYSFGFCDNLTKINIPKSLEDNIRVSEYNFRCFQDTPLSDITFEEGITKLPAGLFHTCILSSITIPNTVVELEDNVFRNCKNLTSIELPEGVKTIGYYCFSDSGLKTAVLPSTIKTVKDSFWGLELERLTVKSKGTISFLGSGYSKIQSIHGYPNTYIHEFASRKNIPFYDIETGELCEKLDYFITYQLDGGLNNTANPTGYKKGEVITLLAPTKEGMRFGGWFLKDGTKITSVSEQSVTVYARWITKDDFWIEDIAIQTYTGKAIKPQVEVYDGDVLLEEKKDYTVTYKNNTKAAGNGAAKNPPSIVITGKGNYSGKETITFTIAAKDIGEDDITVTPILLKYNKKIQKPVPVLKYNGKTLKNKTDFTIEYPDMEEGAYKEAGTYTILLKGKGNFTGEREITFTITENTLMSKVSVAKVKNQPYTGEEIIPGLTVKSGKVLLEEGIDYTVTFENNVEIGTATAILTGVGDYSGEKKVTFKISGGSISKAKVTGVPKSVVYTGEAITSDSEIWSDEPVLSVTVNKEVKILEEGIDYTISYLKNTNKGTATIVFTGINGYSGTLKKNFKITAYDMKKNLEGMFNATVEEIVVYAKGGSKPKPVVTFGDTVLVEGKDYTLSYKNHTKVNDGTNLKKLPTVTIKGKGNFSGSIPLTYTIEAQSLSEMTISVPDKTYANKKNAYKSTPKLVDLDGKTLKAGTDYEKALVYSYRDETILADETIRSAGEVVGANDIVPAGTVIVVTAMGKGNYLEGTTIQGEYRITKASITSAKVQIPAQIYTGEEICPDKDEITIKVGKVTLEDTDYEIVSYENNMSKGKAKVTIKGVGNYGGIKTITFTIKAKGFLWWWR